MYLFFGLFVGLEMYYIITAIITIIVSKSAGMFLSGVKIFNKQGIRTNPESEMKWIKSDKFSIVPMIGYSKLGISAEEDKKNTVTIEIIMGLIVMIYAIFSCSQFWGVRSGIGSFFMGSTFSMIIMMGVVVFYSIKLMNDESAVLQNKYNAIIAQLRSGATFEQIDIPMNMVLSPKVRGEIKCAFLNLDFYKTLSRRDYVALGNITRRLDQELKELGRGTYTKEALHIGFYYPIIFYSTYLNPNHANAIRFYNIAKTVLEADNDPNGLRVKAYYQLYVLKKPELAAITASQAEQGLNNGDCPAMVPAEREMERRLIEELRDNMMKMNSPQQGYQPLIRPDYL